MKNAGVTGTEARDLLAIHRDLKSITKRPTISKHQILMKKTNDNKLGNVKQIIRQQSDSRSQVNENEVGDGITLQEDRSYLWPTEGKFAKAYKYFLMCHNCYYLAAIVARTAFENKPQFFVVILDFYLDFIFIIDMVRCFTQPYVTSDGKTVYNRRKIASHYAKTWFILDLYAFYPLTYLRYISNWD